MPYNHPLQRSTKSPSPPQRNHSTNSNASTSTTASSTSSLEAAPIKPPPIQTRTAATSREQLGDRTRSKDADRSKDSGHGQTHREESSVSPTTPRMPTGRFSQHGTATQSSAGTLTQGPPHQYGHHPYAQFDFPAHLLPAELRPSSSGPDLASLRQRMAEAQLERRTAALADHERQTRKDDRRTSSFEHDVTPHEDNEDEAAAQRPFSTGDVDAAKDGTVERSSRRLVNGRPKLRTRSSSAQVTQVVSKVGGPANGISATGYATPVTAETRKAVTLQDFMFGEVLGRGSYSTVVLAQQKATQMPYAIKILDQHHLVQEKKTKYAKVERDALVLLGPRQASPRASSFSSSPGAPSGHPQNRRGSMAESLKSVRSARSETGRKRDSGEGIDGVRPGPRRNGSADAVKRVSQVYPPPSPIKAATKNGVIASEEQAVVDGQSRFHGVCRRVSNVKEHANEQELDQDQDLSIGPKDTGHEDRGRRDHVEPSSPVKRPVSVFSETTVNGSPARNRLSSLSASTMTIMPELHVSTSQPGKRRAFTGDDSNRLAVPGQEDEHGGRRRKRTRLSHPGVVRLHYTFKDETSLYFVLDLAINGELLTKIKKYGSLDIVSARIYAAQIIDTIEFMHDRGIIHRDIKPENILLDDDMRVKITDFGSAKILASDGKTQDAENPNNRKRSFVGTAEYVSPEVLRNEHASPASDIWAFGCVLFQLIAGRPPFRGATEYLTFQKVLHAEYEYPDGFDPEARDLLERIFKLDPNERPLIDEIKAHPFFASIRFDDIWTDQMPDIHTGLHAPPPNLHVIPSSHGWDEILATPDTDIEAESLGNEEAVETDHEDLEEPRRQWIEHGGGVGSFSSGSGGTDESVMVAGTSALRTAAGTSGLGKAATREASPTLERRGSVAQRALVDKKELWSPHLQKDEKIVYSSPILSRSGLFLPKRRTLVLTDLPRLLCFKEDLIKQKIKVKSECVFGKAHEPEAAAEGSAVDRNRGRSPSPPSTPRTVTKVIAKGPRAFIVQTPDKDYTFIADREDIRQRWVQEIDRMREKHGQ